MNRFLHKAWHRPLALGVYLLAFAAAFFRLPYYFAVPLSASDSYTYQFNNHVAVLIFFVGAAGFAIVSRGLSLRPAAKNSRVSPLSACIAVAVCVAVGLFYWWLSAPYGLHGEVCYFYSRLAQLAAGKTIYRDFEFVYGPLLLYPPYWIARLFHVSLIHGYLAFWLICWAVGIWILFRLVNAIEIPSPYRTIVFFLFVIDLAQPLWPEGLNYAPLRTLLTAGLALAVYTAYRCACPPFAVAATAIFGAAVAAAVSPEHAIAFMLGTTLFFVFCINERPAGHWPSIGAMTVAFLAIVFFSSRAGVYITLRSFASGGYNYPIMPFPNVLCVMALFLVAACVGYLALQRRQTDSLVVYLLCICLFSLPASFGRADSGHMQLGAFSALVIAALALGRYRWLSLVAGVAFLYWPATAQLRVDLPVIREVAERRIFSPAGQTGVLYRPAVYIFRALHKGGHLEAIEEKVARYPPVAAMPAIPTGAVVDAPLGFMVQGYADTTGQIDYGYFFGLQDVFLPSQTDRVTQWLNTHPEREIILWRPYLQCRPYDEGNDASYQTWYGIRWASPKRQNSIYLPLCNFIETHYAPNPTSAAYGWQLWHRIEPDPPPAR